MKFRLLCLTAIMSGLLFGTWAPASASAEDAAHPGRAAEQAALRALEKRRQQMIKRCEEAHGSDIDCVREVDTELRAEALPSGAWLIRLEPERDR